MTSFKQKLNGYKVAELKSLLSSSHIEYHNKLKKAELIDLIYDKVEQKLGEQDAPGLEQLSDTLGIDNDRGARKDEQVSRIMMQMEPSQAPSLFNNTEDELIKIGADLVDIGRDIEETIGIIQAMPASGNTDEIDRLLNEKMASAFEIGPIMQIFDTGRRKYQDRQFIDSINDLMEVRDISSIEFSNLEDIIYAHLILACENLIQKCDDAPTAEQRDGNVLLDAKRAFNIGGREREDAVAVLVEYSKTLYYDEIKLIREAISEKHSLITTMKLQGVDVFNAERYLNRAKDSLKDIDFTMSISYLDKAETSAKESQVAWKEQIINDVPRVELIISTANDLGAAVVDADKMLGQAKLALENADYGLCAELTKIAERKAMEVQQSQIQKAAQLERRQLGEVRSTLESLEPVIREAFIYGVDIGEVNNAIQRSKAALNNNDYVNGKLFVREAENHVKLIMPHLEDIRKNIVQNSTDLHHCSNCDQNTIKIFDNHWARCMSCGLIWPPPPDTKKKKWADRLFK